VKRPQPEISPASQARSAAIGKQPKKASRNRPAKPTCPASRSSATCWGVRRGRGTLGAHRTQITSGSSSGAPSSVVPSG
jgi:hypothetical protein